MEDLISKRELLERYGVSYGALYRWKRMGLIPEDWFLRRATPTGQETFFTGRRSARAWSRSCSAARPRSRSWPKSSGSRSGMRRKTGSS